MEFSYGSVGNDPPQHTVAGSWQGPPGRHSRKAPHNQSLCGKWLTRQYKTVNPDRDVCQECVRREESLMVGVDREYDFAVDHEEIRVPLGELMCDHGHDPATGERLQRPVQADHLREISSNWDRTRWMRDLPWVSDREEISECKCQPCRRPRLGQVVRGRYHIVKGQHAVIALRMRLIEEGWTREQISALLVPVRVFRGCSRQREARLYLQADRDRREQSRRNLLAVEVMAGEEPMASIRAALAEVGMTLTGSGRFSPVKSVKNQAEVQGGQAGIEVARRIIATAVGGLGKSPSPRGPYVNALGWIFNDPHNGAVVSDSKLIDLLQHDRSSPELAKLLASAEQLGWKELARHLCLRYNKIKVKLDSGKLRLPDL